MPAAKRRGPATSAGGRRERDGCRQRALQEGGGDSPKTDGRGRLRAPAGRIPQRFDIHLRFALREGWTEEELTEALLHLTGYVGVPIIREAMLTAAKVFKDVKAEAAER
jgi:hypothetical protein